MANNWKVRIVNSKTKEVSAEMEAHSERAAEKIERGASINLNHEEYHIEVIEPEEE